MSSVDARGLSCPQPALMTRKAIEAGKFPVEVLVDSAASRLPRNGGAAGGRVPADAEPLKECDWGSGDLF